MPRAVPTHKPMGIKAKAHRTRPSTRKMGYTRHWQKISRLFLSWHPLCEHCQRDGRMEPATETDHVTPIADGGTNEWPNLQALCKSCHARKTATERHHGSQHKGGVG